MKAFKPYLINMLSKAMGTYPCIVKHQDSLLIPKILGYLHMKLVGSFTIPHQTQDVGNKSLLQLNIV